MRFQCIVLIALAFFYVGIDTADALIRAEQAVPSKTTDHNGLSSSTNTGRLLRAEIGGDGGEERLPNSEWMSRLAQADRKVPKLRKLDMKLSQWLWIRDGKTPEELFYTFSNLYNTWAKIESNKKTVQWFRFVEVYRAKWRTGRFVDQDIYRLLSTKVREDKLAIVFESLKQIPDVKTLAEAMQNYQFRLWISRKETPTSVAAILHMPGITPLTAERGFKDAILSAFTTMLKKLEGR